MERPTLPSNVELRGFSISDAAKKMDIAALVRFFFFFFFNEYPRPRPPISLSLQSQSVMVKPCCRPPSETPCSFCTGQFSRLERSFGLARHPVHTGPVHTGLLEKLVTAWGTATTTIPSWSQGLCDGFSFSFYVNDKRLRPGEIVGGVTRQLGCRSPVSSENRSWTLFNK